MKEIKNKKKKGWGGERNKIWDTFHDTVLGIQGNGDSSSIVS